MQERAEKFAPAAALALYLVLLGTVLVLAGVGGLDLAAMTGAFLGCAHERVPAAVDGFISIAAALCAARSYWSAVRPASENPRCCCKYAAISRTRRSCM